MKTIYIYRIESFIYINEDMSLFLIVPISVGEWLWNAKTCVRQCFYITEYMFFWWYHQIYYRNDKVIVTKININVYIIYHKYNNNFNRHKRLSKWQQASVLLHTISVTVNAIRGHAYLLHCKSEICQYHTWHQFWNQ